MVSTSCSGWNTAVSWKLNQVIVQANEHLLNNQTVLKWYCILFSFHRRFTICINRFLKCFFFFCVEHNLCFKGLHFKFEVRKNWRQWYNDLLLGVNGSFTHTFSRLMECLGPEHIFALCKMALLFQELCSLYPLTGRLSLMGLLAQCAWHVICYFSASWLKPLLRSYPSQQHKGIAMLPLR